MHHTIGLLVLLWIIFGAWFLGGPIGLGLAILALLTIAIVVLVLIALLQSPAGAQIVSFVVSSVVVTAFTMALRTVGAHFFSHTMTAWWWLALAMLVSIDGFGFYLLIRDDRAERRQRRSRDNSKSPIAKPPAGPALLAPPRLASTLPEPPPATE
jgi:hypothetical protein